MATSQSIGWVPRFMSLWRSPKPVIAQVHGWCVGGGSEMALCADIVMPRRTRGSARRTRGCGAAITRACGSTGSGSAKAKELALTGRSLSGAEAAELGLINRAVPFDELEADASSSLTSSPRSRSPSSPR